MLRRALTPALCAAVLALPASPRAAEATPRVTVAVLYFGCESKDPDLQVLRKGLAQMLIADLSANGSFGVVERARLQDVYDELDLNRSARFDQATVVKVGKLLGAQYIVTGDYFTSGNTMVVSAKAFSVLTGLNVGGAAIWLSGKPEDFLEMEQKMAARLTAALDKVAPAELGGTRASTHPAAAPAGKPGQKLPAKAAIRYSKALDAIDKKDPETAKRELEAVVRENPDFTLASQELASLVR